MVEGYPGRRRAHMCPAIDIAELERAYAAGAERFWALRATADQAAPGWLVAPRLPIHGNQPEGAGPSRITPRTWSTDTPSHGNSTIHHVAPADA